MFEKKEVLLDVHVSYYNRENENHVQIHHYTKQTGQICKKTYPPKLNSLYTCVPYYTMWHKLDAIAEIVHTCVILCLLFI